MAKFAVLLVATLAFTATWAAPKKNQGGAQKNQLDEIGAQLQTVANDISTSLQNVLPDSKQVSAALVSQSQEFASNVENIVNKLKAEIEKTKGTSATLLEQVSTKLSETINSLQQIAGPDAAAKANEIKGQLNTNVKNAAAEIEKLGKAVQPNLQHAQESITNFAKGVMDDFLAAAQNLQTQVQHTIQQGQKQKPK